MTPGRNLLAMLFLPIMAVALLAAQDLATTSNASLPWIPNLADRDPWLVLPLIFGVLITAYVDLAFATSRTRRIVIWLVALPLLIATGALLAASADIYLITSATLLVVQRLWVSGLIAASLARLAAQPDSRGHYRARGCVPTDELRQQGLSPRADARGRNAGAGWRGADARLHDADGCAPARVRHHELAWIWRRLGNANSRSAVRARRGRRQPQLRRRVRVR